MDSRLIGCLLVLGCVLVACAEKNFVPGSPLAKLNGYNRTYEQIASDDCARQGHPIGSEANRRCVAQLAAVRRQQDTIHQQNALATAAAAAQAMEPPPPKDHVCVMQNNTTYYRC